MMKMPKFGIALVAMTFAVAIWAEVPRAEWKIVNFEDEYSRRLELSIDVAPGTTVHFSCFPNMRTTRNLFMAGYEILIPSSGGAVSIIGSFDSSDAKHIQGLFERRKVNGLSHVPFGELVKRPTGDLERNGPIVRIWTPISNFVEIWSKFQVACNPKADTDTDSPDH